MTPLFSHTRLRQPLLPSFAAEVAQTMEVRNVRAKAFLPIDEIETRMRGDLMQADAWAIRVRSFVEQLGHELDRAQLAI
jgi:hypothetical protein